MGLPLARAAGLFISEKQNHENMKSQFVERMIRQLGSRPYTQGQVKGWLQLERAVSTATLLGQWQVIQWPTGTGKTEALITLCSAPGASQHPGALIVTKFTKEADEIVRKINDLAGSDIALAAHSKKAAEPEKAMTDIPVLVITHEAYRAALRAAWDTPDLPSRLNVYHRYIHASRSWIIIDEALNWCDQYEVDLDEALALCSALSAHIPEDNDLRELTQFVFRLRDEQNAPTGDRLLDGKHIAKLRHIDFFRLRNVIKEQPADTTELWRNVALHRHTDDQTTQRTDLKLTTFKHEYCELLRRLDAIKRIGHCWVSQRRRRTRLHSSRLLMGPDRPCGVVLDATASIDPTYELLGNRIAILPRPEHMRSYKNVHINVSFSHHVGKEYLAKNATGEWPLLVNQMSTKISAKSVALVITHKSTKPLLAQRLPCGNQEIEHWGNLDGRNEWNRSDTVLLYGLSYPDDIGPTDLFNAYTDQWSSDWFEGKRSYGDHSDIKATIKYGLIARSVIQAINRARCRTIIDAEGNCAPTDVYILLPRGIVGETVLAALKSEMPGASLGIWRALPAKNTTINATEQRLLSELQGMARDEIRTKKQMIDLLGTTSRTFERMTVKLRDPIAPLARRLTALGVEFRCNKGRGNEAHFVKH